MRTKENYDGSYLSGRGERRPPFIYIDYITCARAEEVATVAPKPEKKTPVKRGRARLPRGICAEMEDEGEDAVEEEEEKEGEEDREAEEEMGTRFTNLVLFIAYDDRSESGKLDDANLALEP